VEKRGTYSDADISDASVTQFETLNILSHFYDGADGFVARNELKQCSKTKASDNAEKTHWEFGDELSLWVQVSDKRSCGSCRRRQLT